MHNRELCVFESSDVNVVFLRRLRDLVDEGNLARCLVDKIRVNRVEHLRCPSAEKCKVESNAARKHETALLVGYFEVYRDGLHVSVQQQVRSARIAVRDIFHWSVCNCRGANSNNL